MTSDAAGADGALEDAGKAEEVDEGGQPAELPYDLVVNIKSARHLPKMDMIGSADPYCIVSLGGNEQRTNKITNTLDPDWNDSVQLQVTSVAQSLLVTIMDWDRLSKDRVIGLVRIPAGRLPPSGAGPQPLSKDTTICPLP